METLPSLALRQNADRLAGSETARSRCAQPVDPHGLVAAFGRSELSSFVTSRRSHRGQCLCLLQDRARLPEIICGLLREPLLCRATAFTPAPALDAQCHHGADRSPPVEHLREGGAIHAQLSRGLAHLQAKCRQHVVPQCQAGMRGGCASRS